jgi:hypothetical protein
VFGIPGERLSFSEKRIPNQGVVVKPERANRGLDGIVIKEDVAVGLDRGSKDYPTEKIKKSRSENDETEDP